MSLEARVQRVKSQGREVCRVFDGGHLHLPHAQIECREHLTSVVRVGVCETDRPEVAQDFVKSRKALVQGLTSKHLEFVVFALELVLSNRLDLGGALMVCVEGHPDVVGGRQVRYTVKLATTQPLDDDVPCLCIRLNISHVPGIDVLIGRNSESYLDLPPDGIPLGLDVCLHSALPEGVIDAIEHGRLGRVLVRRHGS